MEEYPSVSHRRLQRLSATIPISLTLARDDYTTEFDAYTVDVSRCGLRVRTNLLLLPGDMIGVAPGPDSEQPISSRVVWAQRSSLGGSLAGLEFLDTPVA